MMLQKFMRLKFGCLAAAASALTLPKLVPDLCLMPSWKARI